MSSRETILNTIAANQPEIAVLPVINMNEIIFYEDVCRQFITVLESIGGKVELIENINSLKERMNEDAATGKFIVNTIPALNTVDDQLASMSALHLEKMEKAYIKGTLAVAENGAVWIGESQMKNRLVPFICQHLVLVIEKKDIVPTMHHAYQKIDILQEGFGVFIAGPSKTADIEQSLVIGAHGARSTTVYVMESE